MAAAERSEILDESLEKLYSVITDYASYSKFVSGMKESKLVEETSDYKIFYFDIEMIKRVNYKIKIEN